MKTNNPIFDIQRLGNVQRYDQAMSINGTINKTIALFAIMLTTAGIAWVAFYLGYYNLLSLLQLSGMIVGFVLAMLTYFKPQRASITAPLYAVCQGFAIGSLSIILNAKFAGIVTIALGLTMSIFAAMLLIYKTGLIKVTENFKIAIISAMAGILISRLLMFALSFFGINFAIFNTGIVGLVMSIVVIGVAAFNLMVDFDFINKGEEYGYPTFMEWYFAFGLLVSIVWLYVEILRAFTRRR